MLYVKLLRVHHWIKNGLIFVPLFFAGALFSYETLFPAVLAFIGFSAIASTMYIFNDMRDRTKDALHPTKRNRAIASGRVSVRRAYVLVAVLGSFGSTIFYFLPSALPFLLAYIALNVAYSVYLKHMPIIDILVVASFYLLRVVIGGAATGVHLSSWLMLATMFLSLFIVIAKRRAEFGHDVLVRRTVLVHYTKELLDHLLTISAVLAVVVYALYSVLVFASPLAVYTVIPVVAGIFWFLYRVYTTHDAEYPEKLLFTDPILFSIFSLWGFSLLVLLYV